MPGRARRGECGPASFLLCGAALLAVVPAGSAALAFGPARATPQAPAAETSAATKSKPAASSKKKKKSAARRPTAPEPERIREIQQALAREGFYKAEPTGKWDEASAEAMKGFQTAKGLPATGKLEALSLQKLGLGSPVAGVAPPEAHGTGEEYPRPPVAHPGADPPAAAAKPPR